MTTVRRGTSADIDRLAEIQAAALRNRDLDHRGISDDVAGTADIAAWMEREEPRVIVAEERRTIRGWGVIFLVGTSLGAVFVDPETADAAIRQRLLSRLERIAEEAGVSRVRFVVY